MNDDELWRHGRSRRPFWSGNLDSISGIFGTGFNVFLERTQ